MQQNKAAVKCRLAQVKSFLTGKSGQIVIAFLTSDAKKPAFDDLQHGVSTRNKTFSIMATATPAKPFRAVNFTNGKYAI